MSGQLNAGAKEWYPSNDLASFALPSSTATEKEGRDGLGNKASVESEPLACSGSATSSPALEGHRQGGFSLSPNPPAYYPSFMVVPGQNGVPQSQAAIGGMTLEGFNWAEEFERVMALTQELLERQLSGEHDAASRTEERGRMAEGHSSSTAADGGVHVDSRSERRERANGGREMSHKLGSATPAASPALFSELPGCDVVRPLVSGKWTNAATVLKDKISAQGGGKVCRGPGTECSASSAGGTDVDDLGRPLPPLTANGNRRWKKPTKAQQKREAAQKNAFEAFANALLHSVSPFMAPLRERCKASLPHIKVDQRFGKVGQPHTAVAQFVVAPLVANYRPRHFHDLKPGDLMEFHYDFAQVLKQLKSANEILIGYGPVWKRYAVPFCYVNCKEYREEVLSLCPDEVPNMRVEAIYEDDVMKDITEVVLSVEELEPLHNMSFLQAMGRRVNLAPLFDAFDVVFQPLENYRIIIRDLHRAPSTYLIQTSQHEVDQKPKPLVLYGDPKLWYELPVVSRVKVVAAPLEDASLVEDTDVVEAPPHADAAPVPSGIGLKKENAKQTASGGRKRGVGKAGENKMANHGARFFGCSAETAIVAAQLGVSALCLALTAWILWRRKNSG